MGAGVFFFLSLRLDREEVDNEFVRRIYFKAD